MNATEQLAQRGIEAVRREYDDHLELVADFGPAADLSAEVVGDTVIIVVDGESYDIEVDGDAQVSLKNGVLTIDVSMEDQR